MRESRIKYVIRVYALILNGRRQILLCDEVWFDIPMVKFPGGGMEYGEGTLDCLQREAREELRQELATPVHFYTTDYYQPALFYEDTQLISIYYTAKLTTALDYPVSKDPTHPEPPANGWMQFRWAPLDELEPEDLSFPVDRKVLAMLKDRFA